jgi:hypothetical protein
MANENLLRNPKKISTRTKIGAGCILAAFVAFYFYNEPTTPPPPTVAERVAATCSSSPDICKQMIPFEKDAVVDDTYTYPVETADWAAHVAQAEGYRCESISALQSYFSARSGFTLKCNHYQYTYEFADKGKGFELQPPK